jgi:type I restriction enzyme M protein
MFIVFVYIWLPYMILPVTASLERVPKSLIEASGDLGGRPNTTFRKVILPLTVLRRFDCILAPTKAQVLKEHAAIKTKGENIVRHRLSQITKVPFYNLSKFTMAKPEKGSGLNGLLDDPNHLAPNLNSYINGFSPNVGAIMERFKFGEQIAYMAEKDLLCLVIKAFTDPKIDPSPERVDPMQMGYVFEELIRIGAEQSNEEAGEHFTPTIRRARWKSSRPISSASKTTS